MQSVFEFYRDLPVRPKRPERLFFAALPDPETAVRIGQFRDRFLREHRLDGKPIRTDRLHVSLLHVGTYKCLRTKFVYAAEQAAKAVSMPPFEMTLDRSKSFQGTPSVNGGPRSCPLVPLGDSDAVLELHRKLGGAGPMAAEGLTPHMTVSYGPTLVPLQMIEPIRFVVKEFVLVHSMLRLSQYKMVGHWPLDGGDFVDKLNPRG